MELPNWIVLVLTGGGGGAAFAAAIFIFLGKSWIRHQLDKNLESAKSEISFHAAKKIKLHDKEYEVFPEIWARLSDATTSLQPTLSEFRIFPDLESMPDEELKNWMENIDLNTSEMNKLIDSNDRNFLFSQISDYRKFRKSEENFSKFQSYLRKSRIFLSPEIRGKFDDIENLLVEILAAKTTYLRIVGQKSNSDLLEKASDIFYRKVVPLMRELENIVQEKLFPGRTATKQ